MLQKIFTTIFVLSLSTSALYAAEVPQKEIAPIFKSVVKDHGNIVVSKKTAVIFSQKYKKLNLTKAYNLQKQFVKNSVDKGVVIVGFKAGLTTSNGPSQVGLNEPILGVLLEAPLYGNKAVISKTGTTNIMLEQEIAYQIYKKIKGKVTSDTVLNFISSVAPAIEVPELNFPSSDYNGLDIIANNALSYKLMVGEWQSVPSIKKLDEIKLSLHCEGKELTQGEGDDSLGGQVNALVWLVNKIIDQGYEIQEGQILITGNLVKMTPAKPCEYTAKFGNLGNLELLITP